MLKNSKLLLVVVVLSGIAFSALADKGIGKKNKVKVTLNITTPNTLRNSISLNLKSGLKYTGSLLVSQQVDGKSLLSNTLLTTLNLIFEVNERFVIAEPMAFELYRRIGNAACRTDFVRLTIDGDSLGYQLLIEQPKIGRAHV